MWKECPNFQPNEILKYKRKSRSDDPSLTIEEVLAQHEEKIRRWEAENLDAPIPPENCYDEVVSGESISSRREFQKLLKRIESSDVSAVVVKDCARLGRPNTEEIGRISNLFRYTSTYIISLEPYKIFDLRDKWDREQFEREMMSNRDFLDYTKSILGSGKETSLRGGNYINGVTPYGYEQVWTYEGKRKRPTLAIVEEEAKVVRLIFDWYVNEGIGATKICQKLNGMGIKAKKGGLWKKSSVINILKNEHYTGKVVIKKHIKVKTVEDSQIVTRCIFNKDYEVVDGKHPAIIDEEIFNKAKNKIHNIPSVKPSETLQNPYASILKCVCGKTMLRRKDRHTFRYLCDEQMFCGNASVNEVELTNAIIEELKKHLANFSENVNSDDSTKKEKHNEYVSLLESRYVEAEKKELALWEKYTEEQMPKQVFDKLIQKNTEEKQSIERELEIAKNNAPTSIDYKDAIITLHKIIDSLPDASVPASAKNKLLKSVVDTITYARPKAQRYSPEEAKALGFEGGRNGWYTPPFKIDITLKF